MVFSRFLQRIATCHAADLEAFVPWFVGDAAVGLCHRDRVPVLATMPGFACRAGRWVLDGDDFAARSRAMVRVAERLAQEGHARPPLGELYPVTATGGDDVLLAIDRSVVTWFGVHAHGVHLNGVVRTPAGLAMWVARRARGKRTFPGHLDNLVAGGQSIGMAPEQTLVKECHEEAGMPPALAERAVAVGRLHYTQQVDRDLKVDSLAIFDLELPSGFVPTPVDGEVESFAAWSLPEVVASLVGEDPWKPNCALVVLHWLLRHGALDGVTTASERERLWLALRAS